MYVEQDSACPGQWVFQRTSARHSFKREKQSALGTKLNVLEEGRLRR